MYILRSLSSIDYKDVRLLFSFVFDQCEQRYFTGVWSHRERERSLGIYTAAKELVGFTIVKDAKLHYIGVDPLYQSNGVGSRLIDELKKISCSKGSNLCLTPVNNTKLIQWYLRKGFYISRVISSSEKEVPYITMNYTPYNLRNKMSIYTNGGVSHLL